MMHSGMILWTLLGLVGLVIGGDVELKLTFPKGTQKSREALLHTSKQADSAPKGGPYPLVINMHGLGGQAHGEVVLTGDGTEVCDGHPCTFNDLIDRRGWIATEPQGISNSWNGGNCCGIAQRFQIDDVGFLRALVTRIAQDYNIDHKRVFAMGFSNGAIMSWRLACEAPDLVRAIAPSHGILWGGAYSVQKPTCDLSKRVSVLAFGGLKDPLQAGSAVDASVARWRGFYGQTDPRVSFQNASTTCKSTASSGTNITVCESAEGKCATHAYAGSSAIGSRYAAPAEVHSTEQILNFFAAQGTQEEHLIV